MKIFILSIIFCSSLFGQKIINTNQNPHQMVLDTSSIIFEPGFQITANNSSVFLAAIDSNNNGFPDSNENYSPTTNNFLLFEFDLAGNQTLKYLIASKSRDVTHKNIGFNENISSTKIEINKPIIENKVLIYPNPTTGPLKISSLIRVDRVDLYSMTALNLKDKLNIIFEKNGAKLNLESLPNGIYIINITLENNNTISHKIIKN
jgi:hypothetical protein